MASSQVELHWYENDGTPNDDTGGGLGNSWTRHVIEPLGTFTGLGASIAVADIDGDKDPDVYGVSLPEDRILWWENDGTPGDDLGGGLGNSWTRLDVACPPATESPRQAVAADVDGDGDLDIVTGSQLSPDRVAWWENDGTPDDDSCDGTTGLSWAFNSVVLISSSSVAVGDYDRDGDLDIASSNANIQTAQSATRRSRRSKRSR
ncbi:MAG: VCBS repeat-containing protein [bacterium]|nr:VCBS repeat-containing protein [bacterium]